MCLAIPGQILSIDHDADPLARKGRIQFGGIVKEASLACVPEAVVGDYVIIHAGFAISRLDEDEAEATLREFAALGRMHDDQSAGATIPQGAEWDAQSAGQSPNPGDGVSNPHAPRPKGGAHG